MACAENVANNNSTANLYTIIYPVEIFINIVSTNNFHRLKKKGARLHLQIESKAGYFRETRDYFYNHGFIMLIFFSTL